MKQKKERQPLSVAVIGAGYWGKNHVRNFFQLGALKCICDRDENIRRQMVKEYPGVAVADDFSTVLKNPDIDAVIISVPAALHFDLAFKSLMAEKHVFVEKPLSLRHEEGVELVSLASKKKRTLFVGHILQYHPAVIRLKEIVREGVIGRLQYVYSRRLSFGKIRREENILWSFAPHDISIILSLVGEEPHYIDTVGSNFLHARIADVTMTNLKFPSGIGAHIFVSWLNPYKEHRLVVVGSHGMVVFDDTQEIEKKLELFPHKISWKNGMPVPEKAESTSVDISATWEEPLRKECRAFLEAARTGEKPLISGEEGLRVLRILEESQQSLEAKESALRSYGKLKIGDLQKQEHFVHPTAVVDEGCEIGRGSKIWHFSHILPHSKIGENCNVGQNVVIGPDVSIGKNCKIQNNVSIYKGVTLEDGVFCGPSMVFTNIYNPRAEISKMDQVRPTLVKKGATIGANATIVCGTTIGRYAFVGAGAVVTSDVKEHALVVGNPARQTGWICKCGEKLGNKLLCRICGDKYRKALNGLELKKS